MRFHTFFMVLVLSTSLVACGDGNGGGDDGGHAMDAAGLDASRSDAASGSDGSAADAAREDASSVDAATDGCAPVDCPAPPPRCSYVGGDLCSCGTLECPDAGCTPPRCPPIPPDCTAVGGNACTCPTIVCAVDCGGMTCSPTQYCDHTVDDTCSGAGTCLPRPGICPGDYDPVCGCDGVTYSNSCLANTAGVDVAARGECDCRATGCPDGESCEVCRGAGYVCLAAGAHC